MTNYFQNIFIFLIFLMRSHYIFLSVKRINFFLHILKGKFFRNILKGPHSIFKKVLYSEFLLNFKKNSSQTNGKYLKIYLCHTIFHC